MAATHTPGPWYARPNDPWAVYAASPQDSEYAEPSLTICDVRHAGSQISQANANLIAAAPELLAVAYEARGVHRGECEDPAQCPLLANLDAAIAKATGEQP